MKIEIDIITMTDGDIKEIKMFNELYTVHLKQVQLHRQDLPSIVPDRGKRLGMRGHTAIYENILNRLRDTTHEKQYEVLKEYYPTYVPISIKTALTQYRNQIASPIFLGKAIKPYKQRHKRKPEGAVAFVKTYGTWVKSGSVTKVKQAVHKYGYDYKPTFATLLKETGLTKVQLTATIRHLKDTGQLIAVRKGDDTLEIVYEPVVKTEQTI
jgi:hypothetical protein